MVQLKIQHKVNLAILTTFVIIAVIFISIQLPFQKQRMQTMLEKVETLLVTLVERDRELIATEIFDSQIRSLKFRVIQMLKVEDVLTISIFDQSGKLLVSDGVFPRTSNLLAIDKKAANQEILFKKTQWHEQIIINFIQVIKAYGEQIGFIEINYSLEKVEKEQQISFIVFASLLSSILIVMIILLNVIFLKTIIKPITYLRDAMHQMEGGKLKQQIEIKNQDEIGELCKTFNEMSLSISSLTSTFEKFVPQQFVKRVAKEGVKSIKLGNVESAYVTILFGDIRSFTTISEMMTPEEVFRFLNSYMSIMEPSIHEFGGFVDKFIGDAIMALFDLGSRQKAAHSAINASIGMQKALKIYNRHRSNYISTPIRTGIGIHSGNVMIGTVGSAERMDSTAIGDAVNVASRIEGLTKMYGASILISDATFYNLTEPSQYSIRALDQVAVKGKKKPTMIFEVFDEEPPEIKEKKLKTQKRFEEAISLYRLMKFEEVIKIMEEHLKIFQEDKAAKIYLERCQVNLIEGTNKHWTDVTYLNTK